MTEVIKERVLNANDILLLADSAGRMQKLLNIWIEDIKGLKTEINTDNKSKRGKHE